MIYITYILYMYIYVYIYGNHNRMQIHFKTFRQLSFSINLLYMSINNIYKLEFLLTFSVYNKILLIIQKN